MSKKSIRAPLTHNPGKGRPSERLAYLNDREMAYLRSLNGNNMERGPRGLPSFAEDRPSGPNSGGPGGPNGPNSGPSSSGTGGGGKGPGGPNGPNSGPSGGQRGPSPSRTSASAGRARSEERSERSETRASVARTPTSPMGGQGSSFSAPSKASSYNKDAADRQRVQSRDAANALRSTAALKGDLQSGGIRSINVGPMGTSVSVGKGFVSSKSVPTQSISKSIVDSMRQQYGAYKNPNAPAQGFVGDRLSEYLKAQSQFERDMRDLGQLGGLRRPGGPIEAGAYFKPPHPLTGTGYGKFNVPKMPTAPETLGGLPRPELPEPIDIAAMRREFDINYPRKNETIAGKTSLTQPPAGSYEFSPEPTAGERILSVETVPPEAAPPLTSTRQAGLSALNTVGGVSPFQSPTDQAFDDVYDPNADFSEQIRIPSWGQSRYAGEGPRKTRSIGDSLTADATSENPMQDEGVLPENVKDISPTTQMPAFPEETIPEKVLKNLPFGIGASVRAGRSSTKKEFENMTPEEQGAMMAEWTRRRDEYIRNRGPVNDRRPIIPVQLGDSGPYDTASAQAPTGAGSGGIPKQYYYWDLGMNIPSPGDSDYTLYVKYLHEKAASQAADQAMG